MKTEEQMAAARRRPVSEAALELLDKMAGEGWGLIVGGSLGQKNLGLLALDGSGRRISDDLHLKITKSASDALHDRGYVVRVERDEIDARLRAARVAGGLPPRVNGQGKPIPLIQHFESVSEITEGGLKALAAERGRLDDIYAARRVMEEQPRFLVVARNEYGNRLAGAGALVRIVRETEGRFYVTRRPEDDEARRVSHDWLIKGNHPTLYVEKADVVAVDVTEDQWKAMRAATRDFEEAAAQAKAQMDAEIAPIMRRAAQRREQLLAELADGLREAGAVPVAPVPPAGPKRG